MTRVVYVNGRYLPYSEACVHAEDRGFQFADAVYEVCEIRGGRLVDETRHMARLQRSLGELRIAPRLAPRALAAVMRETIRRNRVTNGLLYLQVTRGAAPRDFQYPAADVLPTVVCLARRTVPERIARLADTGIAVKTMPDFRWGRCDIKTVMLLPAVLAKEAARTEGAREAWFLDANGFVTEGASSNAWIVAGDRRVITRSTGNDILAGVTRATVIDLLARGGLTLEERAFHIDEARLATEAFNTSASGTVMPVVRIDGQAVADGKPGPIARLLRSTFHQVAEISGAGKTSR